MQSAVDEAIAVMAEMKDAGVERTTLSYNNLIVAYSKAATMYSCHWVDSVLAEMQARASWINGRGRVNSALYQASLVLLQAEGLKPDAITLKCLLFAYTQMRPPRIEDAEDVLAQLEELECGSFFHRCLEACRRPTLSTFVGLGSVVVLGSGPLACSERTFLAPDEDDETAWSSVAGAVAGHESLYTTLISAYAR